MIYKSFRNMTFSGFTIFTAVESQGWYQVSLLIIGLMSAVLPVLLMIWEYTKGKRKIEELQNALATAHEQLREAWKEND